MVRQSDRTEGGWKCPSLERADHAPRPDRETIASYRDAETVRKLALDNPSIPGFTGYLLPVCQNMEALVYGRQIQEKRDVQGQGDARKEAGYPAPGDYCIHSLKEIEVFEFELLSDPLIRTVLETIRQSKGAPLILEVESPFSILAGLMDPMELYLCFGEEGERLKKILERMAAASADYIISCIRAGCRIVSLADPLGTMDLVGPDHYRDFCGASEVSLMKKCRPGLDRAVIHLCMKMSRSLVLAGLAEAEPRNDRKGAIDLYTMAEDPAIQFTGMTCIHSEGTDMSRACVIHLL